MTAHWTMAADTPEDEGDFGVAVDSRTKTKRPPLYKVLILNDDYTPMEFVIMVLERFFGLTHQESFELMLTVHKNATLVKKKRLKLLHTVEVSPPITFSFSLTI